MSAKNPFKTSDLISKYGWQAMVYLSNLGVNLLSEAALLFVDSGATNALDADDTIHGHSFDQPLATLDYAIGLCTANQGDVILVAPGHNEALGSAETIDFDVSGITVIGIGTGSNRPTIDFDHATAGVDVGANNVWIRGLRFLPSVTTVAIGVDVEAGVTGTIIEDCEFAEGEDGAGVDEFVLAIDVKAGCTNTKIKDCLIRSQVGATHCTDGIKFTGTSDNCIVTGCRIIGNFSTAAITNDTGACTDLLINDCTIKVKDGEPGIEAVPTTTGIIRNVDIESTGISADNAIVAADMAWFGATVVTADGTASVVIGGGEVESAIEADDLDHLVKVAAGTDVYPVPLATDSIIAMMLCKGAAATAATYNNTTDSQEAIADAIATAITQIGTEFWVKKTLTSSGVVQAGIDVTDVSATGELAITDVVVKSNATGLAAGTNFELLTDNVKGLVNFYVETVANLGGAVKTVDLANASITKIKTVVEVGKKIIAKSTVADCTGAGTIDVYIKFQRLTDGATIAAV